METEEYVKVAGYVFLYDLEEDLQVVTAIKIKRWIASFSAFSMG